MSSAPPGVFDRPRIVVADEDPAVVAFIVNTLRQDGNAVFPAYDTLSATQLAFSLDVCHLLISNTRVEGGTPAPDQRAAIVLLVSAGEHKWTQPVFPFLSGCWSSASSFW